KSGDWPIARIILWSGSAIFALLFITRCVLAIQNGINASRPESLVNYYSEKGYQGKIFNYYDIGGYLIYGLSPQSKVYIDGRTGILYDYQFYERYKNSLLNESVLSEELNKYEIDFAILPDSYDMTQALYSTGLFGVDYADRGYFLFKR